MTRTAKLLPVRLYGDKTLKRIAEPVQEITPEIKEFIEDLTYTMYETDGVGLAAPQVGRSLRIFVIDTTWFDDDAKKNPIVMINPEFVEFEGEEVNEEGCLSLPDIYEKVHRAGKVKIKGMNEKGELVEYEGEDLLGRAFQHEYDHLDGIMFIDKIAKLRRAIISRKLRDLASTTDENGVNVG